MPQGHEPDQVRSQRGPADPASGPRNGQGIRRIVRAMACSLRGVRAAFTSERAFRQEIAVAAILIPAACALPFSAIERLALVGSVLLVLVVELLNTAIEKTLDRLSTETHPLTGAAKDMGSAAVLLAIVIMILAWLSIAGPVIVGLLTIGY
jgi:diacylglycerol kinase (ATP)